MGHQIFRTTFDGKMTKAQILAECKELSRGSEQGPISSIRFYDTPILNGINEAEAFLDKEDNGWYDNLAVQYRDPSEKPSKRMSMLRQRLNAAESKYRDLVTTPVTAYTKAKYVGCKKCGSKLSTEFLSTWFCPLCRQDLRSETHAKKIEAAHQQVENLKKLLSEEEARIAAKSKTLKWLVKIEYHV